MSHSPHDSIGLTRQQYALLAIIITVGFTPAALANERYDAWQAQRPFVQTAWASHTVGGGDVVDLDFFHGSGLNTFWDGVRTGSWDWKHPDSQGLPTLLMSYLSEKPDLPAFLDDYAKAKKKHSQIIGLVLGDEVRPESRQHMRTVRDWVVNNDDPDIASMITICSMPGFRRISVGPSAQGNWEESYAAMRPDVWLVQVYPFNFGQLESYYYSGMETSFNWTKEKDMAWWVYPQTQSSDKQNVPSESQLRLQKFTSLAYGVRGFADFLWYCGPGSASVVGAGYWDGSGKPTPLYQLLAPINREVAQVAKSLIRLKPVGAYHMDGRDDHLGVRHWSDSDADIPPRMRRTWKLANVTGAANRNHLLVGFFRDAAGLEYFMVVNKDHAKDKTGDELATEVTLSFHPSVKGIQRLRRSDGKVERIAVDRNYMFTLPGGTGDLFKFDTGSPFAGIEPLVLPKLVESRPVTAGVLGRVAKNRIVLTFDRDATGVEVEIHKLDEGGKAVGLDLAEHFTRALTDDNRTLSYEEQGVVLANKSTYRVTLYAADDPSLTVRTVRGDVDGDGKVTERDLTLTTRATGAAEMGAPVDLDGNGKVDQEDLYVIKQVVHPEKFRWADSFEDYPVGILVGQGGWVEVETQPGSMIAKAWLRGPLEVTEDHADIDGPRKVTGGPKARGLGFRGAEIRFHDGGGLGDVGQMRCGFTVRLGKQGLQNIGFFLWNSRDVEGVRGRIQCEVVNTTLRLHRKGRGVKVLGDGTTGSDTYFHDLLQIDSQQGPDGKGVAVEFLVDFDAATIAWTSTDLNSGAVSNPHKLHYRGRLAGLDAIGLAVTGENAEMDDFWVQNY